MKKFLFAGFFLFLVSGFVLKSQAQDIEVIVHATQLIDTLGYGNIEAVFDFEVINISMMEQSVFEVRTINDLPQDWTSSLCFGELCFPPDIDSVVTADPFPQPPLQPGDTLITSLHVYPLTNVGVGHVQLQVGTLRNPDVRVILDFYTTGIITDVNETGSVVTYSLDQNYPNPFNPSTNIVYSIPERGNVSIKLYDVLGNEIADILNEDKEAGEYSLQLNTQNYDLSSGVYFYTMRVNDFVQTRKLILEK
ncbi:MAG: T9SS type A sorting domain-containing protein [Ignavibacteriales bacterium]|nr:MAG: T9SS type A sorting domain-containing protein [Ignavibacteriales bacterium]